MDGAVGGLEAKAQFRESGWESLQMRKLLEAPLVIT
jgi:hypothetical protein